jgi:hypothetical protein
MHAGTIVKALTERWELRALKPCDVAGWRRLVRNELAERGYEADDAGLVASELLTNMCNHTPGDGALWVQIRRNEETGEEELFIGVSDRDPRVPIAALPDWRAECGRGMVLVKALASSWDVIPSRNGKIVYAMLPLRHSDDGKDSSWGLAP